MWTPKTTYQSNTVHIRRYDWMSRDGKSPLDPKFEECIVKLCEPFEHKSTYSKPMHFSHRIFETTGKNNPEPND